MKNLILTLASLTVLFGAAHNAEATSMARYSTYQLSEISLDPNSMVIETGYTYRDGFVSVDYLKNTLTLSLNPIVRCPPMMACAAVMPQAQTVTLPIIGLDSNQCGTTIRAEKDDTPRDGIKVSITLKDSSRGRCFHAPYPSVTVNLSELAPRTIHGEVKAESVSRVLVAASCPLNATKF